MEIQTVIETIRKLSYRTVDRGCTEAEALQAAEKIGELLKVYDLSMDKVYLGETKCVTKGVKLRTRNRQSVDYALVSIAAFCDCKVWHHKNYKKDAEYRFFGLEPDTDMAIYLYETVDRAIEAETERFRQSPTWITANQHRKRLSSSFQKGMALRISARLKEMKAQRDKEVEAEIPKITGTGTSLLVVKKSKVDDEFRELNLGLRSSYAQARSVHDDAYAAGQEAGDNVNLNRPLGGQVVGYLGHG